MLRTTLAGLKLHAARYVTTTLAILLGVMFICGTMVFADTLEAGYEESVMGSATSVDAIAVPSEAEGPQAAPDPGSEPDPPAPLTEGHLEQVRALPGAETAEGMVNGRAALLDTEGRASGFQPPAAVSVGESTRFSAQEGSLPTADDEIALAASTASETGFEVGDTVTVLDPEQEEHEFTVTGLVNFGVDPEFSFSGAMALTEGAAREVTGAQGYGEIDAVAAEGTTDEELAGAMGSLLGDEAEVSTGTEFGQELAENVGGQSQALSTVLLLFGVVAMFVASIVIYNTFAILITQRQRELALLRCVGAERGQVFGSVLAESFVVGLVSSALGVLAGVGTGLLGARWGGPLLGADVAAPVVVSPATVVTGMLVGTVVTVLSALVPALRATRVAPLAALRTSATAVGIEKGTGWVRVVFGLLCLALSAVMVALPLRAGTDPVNLYFVTGAALVAFVGVVVLGPLLVRGIVGLVGAPLRRTGAPGMLAVDNSTRSPRRAATAMIALTVGATLITGYSVVSSSFESTMSAMLDEQFPVDYQISPQFNPEDAEAEEAGGPEPIPGQVRRELAELDTVGTVFGQRTEAAEAEGEVPGAPSETFSVTAYFGAEVGGDITSEVVEGDLDDLAPGGLVLPESRAGDLGVGDTLTLTTPEEGLELEVVAVVEEMQTVSGPTVAPEDFLRLFPDSTGDTSLMLRGAEGAAPADLRSDVHGAVEEYPLLQVASASEIKNQFTEMIEIAFYAIAAMLALALVIAVFGISNTMALSVLERTRESALLRALGLARAQLRRMLSIEAVLLCLIGAGIGIAFGVVFGWAAGAVVLPDMVFEVPLGQIAVFIGAALVAGLLAAMVPARRAARTSITGSLAGE